MKKIMLVVSMLMLSILVACTNSNSDNSSIPFLLNISSNEAVEKLEKMGATVRKVNTEEGKEYIKEELSVFDIELPDTAIYYSYESGPRVSFLENIIVVDEKVVAYSGHSSTEGTDDIWTMLNEIGIQGIGERKTEEPLIWKCNGTPHDEAQTARAVYEFDNSNLQIQLIYRSDDMENWEKAIPIRYLFVRNDLATIEGHADNSAIFNRQDDGTENSTEFDYSDFNVCPFSQEQLVGTLEREDWYDNGIFSTYAETAYSGQPWTYIGTTVGELDPNPYGYDGYDVYQMDNFKQYLWFVVPYSQYTTIPVVYAYDMASNTMKIVYQDGGLVE